ncbi:MAG TPA: ThiF family adenylyltransferase, partial [Planctomycetota bacterium]|nr:ThiF family adenylyltransferase [Planctomycetota bacterium]
MIGKLAPSEAFAEDQGVNTTDSDESASRYSRQVLFPAIGEAGQARILASTVTVVGCGALGASQGELLARAGVGRIRLIDRDIVERSNLGRQALYRESDALERRPKAVALAAHLREFNREIEVLPQVAHLAAANVDELLLGSDVILDGSDNFDVRYLINDWAVRESVPWVYGACVAARGLSAVILPGRSPCLRCLFPDPPPKGASQTCDTAGIIAPAATIIASLQVAEVLKILVGADAAIRRSLLSVDLWPFRIFEMGGPNSAPATDCPCCGRREFTFLSQEQGARALVPCGRDAVFIVPGRG